MLVFVEHYYIIGAEDAIARIPLYTIPAMRQMKVSTKKNTSPDFSQLNSGLTGRDHYDSIFSESLDHQIEWLRRTAQQKANAVCTLLDQNDLKPSTILDIGCGTGAVIAELQRQNVGESFHALDYSADAIKFVNKMFPKVDAKVGDVSDCSNLFPEKKFDLIICSHVIEHLEYPADFLRSLGDINWNQFIAEVPLENLLFGKMKDYFQDRGEHPSGHVQFFNKSDFLELLSRSGLNVFDEYIYAPKLTMDTIKFAYGNDSYLKFLLKICTEHYFPKNFSSFWTKFYHAHMSVLCTKNV